MVAHATLEDIFPVDLACFGVLTLIHIHQVRKPALPHAARAFQKRVFSYFGVLSLFVSAHWSGTFRVLFTAPG
jgi:hypothetical protein